MSDTAVRASIRRRVLAWFIDYLLFAVAWALLAFAIDPVLSVGGFLLSLIVFLILRAILGYFIVSPGYALLSIDGDGDVDPEIKEGESWLTMTLGVLILLGGTKQLVRWTQIDAVWPYFGFVPGPVEHVVISVVFGVVSVVAGCLILKLRRLGQILGIAVGAAYLASAVLSWNLWDRLIADQVQARRAVQGLPVRAGEVEFMQALFPEVPIAVAAVMILLLLIPSRRFS